MVAQFFFQIEGLNTQANFCEKDFLANIRQKLQWSRRNEKNNYATRTEPKNPSIKKKGKHRGI